MKATAALLAIVVVVAGTGCVRGAGARFEPVDEQVQMKVTVVLRGDREITIRDRTVATRFIRFPEGSGVSQLKPMLAVQPEKPIIEEDVAVLPGFALVGFTKDGRYTIEAGAPSDRGTGDAANAAGAPATSGVRVEWLLKEGDGYEYLRRAKPCTVETEDKGMRGRLRCPDITHEAPGGPHFSLDFRWEKA